MLYLFRKWKELFTAHALSTKLKMKMLSSLFYLLLQPMVLNLELHSQNGNAVVFPFSRVVSTALIIDKHVMKTFRYSYSQLPLVSYIAAERLLRTDPVEDKEGFFIALFVRRGFGNQSEKADMSNEKNADRKQHVSKRIVVPATTNLFKIWAHAQLSRPNCSCCR